MIILCSPIPQNYVSPATFLDNFLTEDDALTSLNLVTILNKPYYEMVYTSNGVDAIRLVDALTGNIKMPLTEQEAILVATQKLNVKATVMKVSLVEEIGNHHEYRGRPLPAYAIAFDAPANTTVYVSKEYGNVQTFRNNQWRIFDFLWMMHTMDYKGRDDLNNWVLRIFSVFGMVTILSGFTLYYLTSKYGFQRKKGSSK